MVSVDARTLSLFSAFQARNPYAVMSDFFNEDLRTLLDDIDSYVLSGESDNYDDDIIYYSPSSNGDYVLDMYGEFVAKCDIYGTTNYVHISQLFKPKTEILLNIPTIINIMALSYQAYSRQMCTMNAYIVELERLNAILESLQIAYQTLSITLASFTAEESKNPFSMTCTKAGIAYALLNANVVEKYQKFCSGLDWGMVSSLLHTFYLFGNDTTSDPADYHGAWTWQAISLAMTQYGPKIARVLVHKSKRFDQACVRKYHQTEKTLTTDPECSQMHNADFHASAPSVYCDTNNLKIRKYTCKSDDTIIVDSVYFDQTSSTNELVAVDSQTFVKTFLGSGHTSANVQFKCLKSDECTTIEDGWECRKYTNLSAAEDQGYGDNYDALDARSYFLWYYTNVRNGGVCVASADNKDGYTLMSPYDFAACRTFIMAKDLTPTSEIFVNRMELSSFNDSVRRKTDQLSKEMSLPQKGIETTNTNLQVVLALGLNLVQTLTSLLTQIIRNVR
jgi:hypothetical protein